jgi:uncharacterized hydrophobic protein (TIGR00271 family)
MSFEEPLRNVEQEVGLDASYLTLMASSGILSAVALLTNSVPVLIGAMVIAPALPPLELVSIAAVRRRYGLAARGVWVVCVGLLVGILGAVAVTWLLNVTNVIPPATNLLEKPLLEERVSSGWYSVITAATAGIAGNVGTIEQRTDTLVGVVTAVALLPAAAAGSIAFLSNDPVKALGGFVLLGINVIVIIIVGVVTLRIRQFDQQSS